MMSISTSDPPERVLEVLRALRADHRERIEEFPELAAAVASCGMRTNASAGIRWRTRK